MVVVAVRLPEATSGVQNKTHLALRKRRKRWLKHRQQIIVNCNFILYKLAMKRDTKVVTKKNVQSEYTGIWPLTNSWRLLRRFFF